MQHALLLEFTPDRLDAHALYDAVNAELGLGEGGLPAGAISHTAGMAETGQLIVFEVWETREAQEEFMHLQLAPALQKHGAPAPTSVRWIDVYSHRPA
jgi:hypothetical protein